VPCHRFGSAATCRSQRSVKATSGNWGVRPPKTKALTGQRTPKNYSKKDRAFPILRIAKN
jgi:hypothetical protein